MKIRFIIFSLTLAALGAVAIQAQVPAPKDVVKPAAYPSFDPAARGKQLEVAVVMKIREGYHVNARETTFDYLIPTDLKAESTSGLRAGPVAYPKGTLHNFNFT